MNSFQAEKIRSLITQSPLLTPAERDEWLSLLEVMNDKQVLELERILVPAVPISHPAAPAPIPTPHAMPSAAHTVPPAVPAIKPSNADQSPHLSHILNMPADVNKNVPATQPATTQHAHVQPVVPQKQSGFTAKLKATLSEKELTAGNHPAPAELTAPQAKRPPIPSVAPTSPKPPVPPVQPIRHVQEPRQDLGDVTPPSQPTPAVFPPAPSIPTPPPQPQKKVELSFKKPESSFSTPAPQKPQDRPHVQPARPTVQPTVRIPEKEVAHEAAPAVPLVPSLSKIPFKLPERPIHAAPPSLGPGPNRVIKPGLQNPNMLLNAQLAEKLARDSVTMPRALTHPGAPKSTQPLPLDSLKSVAQFSVTAWKTHDAAQLQQQLRDLVKRFGYYDVKFNLEHSPLYSAYIDTGLKILKEQSNFENLQDAQEGLAVAYLTREEFEQFTDALRKIQAE